MQQAGKLAAVAASCSLNQHKALHHQPAAPVCGKCNHMHGAYAMRATFGPRISGRVTQTAAVNSISSHTQRARALRRCAVSRSLQHPKGPAPTAHFVHWQVTTRVRSLLQVLTSRLCRLRFHLWLSENSQTVQLSEQIFRQQQASLQFQHSQQRSP